MRTVCHFQISPTPRLHSGDYEPGCWDIYYKMGQIFYQKVAKLCIKTNAYRHTDKIHQCLREMIIDQRRLKDTRSRGHLSLIAELIVTFKRLKCVVTTVIFCR